MIHSWFRRWRRDVLVGGAASLLTALVLVPVALASYRSQQEQADAARRDASAAARRAEQMAAETAEQRALAQRALVAQAVDFAGLADNTESEALRVTTAAVSPEVPKDAWLVVDKKAVTYAAGDIVVIREGGNNFLGRVVAVDLPAGHLTVTRNGEKNKEVAIANVLGRGVLNTR